METSIIKYQLGYILTDLKFRIKTDQEFNKEFFKKKKGYVYNETDVTTFSEKLIYLKEHYRNAILTLCSDKYYVKEYLKLCGCEEISKRVYGVYKRVEDINFNELPDEFFIHCNHMSGCNFKFSKHMDEKKKKYILDLLKINLKHNWYHNYREWNYKNIEPLIVCEECLKNIDGTAPIDYKFYCFSGEPKYWMVSKGEYDHNVRNHKLDMQCQSIDHYFKKKATLPLEEVQIPENFKEMVNYVKKLCKPFPHVRVDLYNVDGRIVFGELTFFSDSGAVNMISREYEEEIGSWISLKKYERDFI